MIHKNPRTDFCRTEDSLEADSLPEVTQDSPFKSLNQAVVQVNIALAAGYKKIPLP